MYRFKLTKEEKKKLLDGRTIISIARKLKCSPQYLTSIMTGYRVCGRAMAYCICKTINSELEVEDLFERTK